MKNYKDTKITVKELISITCDVCGEECDHEHLDYQEYTRIHFVGGFTSIFEDGGEYECDICQNCLKNLIGDKLRYLGSRI
jgi:hypothetical protein